MGISTFSKAPRSSFLTQVLKKQTDLPIVGILSKASESSFLTQLLINMSVLSIWKLISVVYICFKTVIIFKKINKFESQYKIFSISNYKKVFHFGVFIFSLIIWNFIFTVSTSTMSLSCFVNCCKYRDYRRLKRLVMAPELISKQLFSLLILKLFLVSFLLIVLIKSLNYFNIHWNILNRLFCRMTSSACLNDSMLIKSY